MKWPISSVFNFIIAKFESLWNKKLKLLKYLRLKKFTCIPWKIYLWKIRQKLYEEKYL